MTTTRILHPIAYRQARRFMELCWAHDETISGFVYGCDGGPELVAAWDALSQRARGFVWQYLNDTGLGPDDT